MLIFHRLTELNSEKPPAVCLGFFDGVHLGHRAVISAALRAKGCTPVVLTFAQHPREALRAEKVPRLCSDEKRLALFEEYGVEAAIVVPFSEVSAMTANEFLICLRDRLGAKALCFGENFRFGAGRTGNVSTAAQFCAYNDIICTVVRGVTVDGQKVSSTVIRREIESGEISAANRKLGHYYTVQNEVISGQRLGRQLGFATINQLIPQNMVMPRFGVYQTETLIGGRVYPSVSSIGVRPSALLTPPLCETHILDYEGDLYGTRPEVALLDFIRPEHHFVDLKSLVQAVKNDIAVVRGRVIPQQ